MNDIIAIRARAAKATEGPWGLADGANSFCFDCRIITIAEDTLADETIAFVDCENADAAFIAHARVDVPALCDEVETLRARGKRMREALEEAEAGLCFAGADMDIPDGDFVPAKTLALRIVRQAIKDTSNE